MSPLTNVRAISVFTLLLVIAAALPHSGAAQTREEFSGPFPSWADVRKRFGAKGNGRDDDTRALQQAIDQLCNPATGENMTDHPYGVIYLPAGTYCISATLVLKGKIGISIIGEDPTRTIIRWTGGDGKMLFLANGSACFKIARLTWDAGGKKDMEGIGIHWLNTWNDGKTRSFASLNIELSDNVFIGGFKYGIGGGTNGGIWSGTGMNDSEITIRRCVFRDTHIGIQIEGYNALDYWIWDCTFIGCYTGISCSFGNYHVYRSWFSGSPGADLLNKDGYYCSVRDCYSDASHVFYFDLGSSGNPFKRIFQNNVVARPGLEAIEYHHLGKLTLWDNQFQPAKDTSLHRYIYFGSWYQGNYEILSQGNRFPYAGAVSSVSGWKSFSTADAITTAPGRTAAAFQKTMEPTPPLVHRTVLEVPPNAGSHTIQDLIEKAAALTGNRPIVHFPPGNYDLDEPLRIPAGSDMQLIGDGFIYISLLQRKPGASFSGLPLLLVEGPSYITIKDLQLGAEQDKGRSAAIVFEHVDQPGAEAHLDQIYSHADTSLAVDDLNYLYIQKDNSFFTAGNYISGGALVAKGGGTARVACNGGQFAGLAVKKNGRFLARDCWWEGTQRIPLDLSGEGRITIDGAMIAPDHADSLTTIRIGKFRGSIQLLDMYLQGALTVQPDNPALDLLLWNVHFYYKTNPTDELNKGGSYRAAMLGINAQCFDAKNPACKDILSIGDRTQNVPDPNAFLSTQTQPARMDAPQVFRLLPAGISNIYISRVTLGEAARGIDFRDHL